MHINTSDMQFAELKEMAHLGPFLFNNHTLSWFALMREKFGLMGELTHLTHPDSPPPARSSR
jgi:hypothetical protein